jgi:hypothetical protein
MNEHLCSVPRIDRAGRFEQVHRDLVEVVLLAEQPSPIRGAPEQRGMEDLVERRFAGIYRQARRRLQRPCVVLEADPRRGRDQLVRVVDHPREADADVADALPEPRQVPDSASALGSSSA